MRHLGEDELTQGWGIGYPGEVRTDLEGNLHQWVEGYDGLGNPVGFWKKLRRFAKRALPVAKRLLRYHPAVAALRLARPFLRRALPIAQRFAPFVPGYGPLISRGLKVASPLLRQAGVAGYNGLGALYQAPDGSLYQAEGFAVDEELRGLEEDDDLRGISEEEEVRGLGALYQAPDGTLYQLQGLNQEEDLRGVAEDEELRGLTEDEDIRGLGQDEELRGLDEDEELRGIAEDEELRGLSEDEELRGLAEEEELRGLGQGYVPDTGASGVEGYVPEQEGATRWFVTPSQPPKVWESLW